VALLGLFLTIATAAFAKDAPPGPPPQARSRIVVSRLTGPVTLDGHSDESAWELVKPMSLVQLTPVAGAKATESSEFLLGYDDRYLYVAGRLFDREARKIQSTTKRRDAETASAEWFGIVIDSFNDKQNALAFFTTPAGLRWDAAVQNDGAGSAFLNVDWNTDWDVATSRTDRGWFAEFRIPLANLKFQSTGNDVVMGVISWRLIARKNEVVVFPPLPDTWGVDGRFKPSQAQEVVFSGITPKRPLYFAPYALGGIRSETAGSGGRLPREFGIDAKFGVSNNTTIDVTVNPDFAQVEADDVQINLTRSALFYPEKRPFFQERSSVFNLSFGGPNTLFYSRRVGLDHGRPIRILGGARLIGRMSGWDLGALNMQVSPSASEGGVNIGVARVRRQVLNASSYVGGMMTSRVAQHGVDQYAFGIDSLLRVKSNDYLRMGLAQTLDTGTTERLPAIERTRADLQWERRVLTGVAYQVGGSYAGRAYTPRLGFEERRDFTSGWASVAFGWMPGPGAAVLLQRVGLDVWGLRSNSRGVLESSQVGLGWATRTKSGYRMNVSSRLTVENVAESFGLAPDVSVPAGRHGFGHVLAVVTTPATRAFGFDVGADVGQFYDGRLTTLYGGPHWQAPGDLEFSATYEMDHVAFPARGQAFTSHIGRLRLTYLPSTRLSFSALVQRNSVGGVFGANLRMRYNPREGVDLWIVYDVGGADRPASDPPIAAPSRNSMFQVKYVYTLRTAVGGSRR